MPKCLSCIKFMQKRTSSRDNASPSTPNTEVPDADSPSVNATPFESENVNESMESSSYDYEVFLSFRGPDTRSGFTDFLYTRLNKAGIRVYRDDEELRIGEEIVSELLQAINQSKILIPIFSKGYASSKWCLMELVQMVECKNEIGQKIMPIFYDVAPREVRHQIGDYEKAFDMHAKNKRYDDRTINKWKDALTQVGALKGWDLTIKPNRREGEFVEEVTRRILTELKKAYLEVSDCLVDMDSKVEEIIRLIGPLATKTKIIGIHGMGGIGKTTLAKIVYNRLACHFQYCCFLANIRETSDREGIKGLQNQFIFAILRVEGLNINNVDEGIEMIKMRLCHKRVLLLFDDVDKKTQLDALIGDHRWYGKGSKVIITTRNKEILNVPQVDWSYELLGMDFDNSLQLFSRHAFRRDHPLEGYYSNTVKAINISGGLPLALEVIGSFLCGKDKNFWASTLKKLEKVPHEDVKKKLMISFEVLDDRQKNIFLDIACFFSGFDRKIVVYMWDRCDFFPEEAIEVLQQRSLIKVTDDDQLWMHDQLRDLGRDIVHQKSKTRTNKQSRLWDHVQIFDVLKSKEEMRNIEAICLKFDHQSQYCFTDEEFERLPNLGFLQIESINFDETAKYKFISKEPPILPKLKWLSWHRVPQDFTLDSFSLMELVILDLSRSKITENWDRWNHIKIAKNLKVLNLTGCKELERTPDFSNYTKIERLILEGCERLAQIDRSIGQLTHLVLLNVNYCHRLRQLPIELSNLEDLTELLIESTSIRSIPKWRGMKKLEILNACGCKSLVIHGSIGYFTSLTRLSLVFTTFSLLPDSIGGLLALTELDISFSEIIKLPNTMGKMKNLKVLRFGHSSLEILPSTIGLLEKLEEIHGEGCFKLEGEIPNDIVNLQFLRILRLTCTKIELVPKLPDGLISLWFETSSMTALEDCSNLTNMRDLRLSLQPHTSYYEALEDPCLWWIGSLCKLECLSFRSYCVTTICEDIIILSQLKKLVLQCHRLRYLPRLPTSLSYLRLENCNGLSTSLDLSNLVALKELYVINCSKIEEIQGLEGLENLRIMELRAPRLQKLPDLTNLRQLRRLHLRSQCVVELKGTFESLERIEFKYCFNLEKVPDPSSFKKLKCVYSICSKKLDGYVKSSDNWRNWIQNNEHVFSSWGPKLHPCMAVPPPPPPPMQPPLGNFY